MANLLDYLEWRGDLTLAQSPFNEVDNLILAELSFVNFNGIVPAPGVGSGMPLKQAADAVLVDTSDMNIEQVLAAIKTIVQEKIG